MYVGEVGCPASRWSDCGGNHRPAESKRQQLAHKQKCLLEEFIDGQEAIFWGSYFFFILNGKQLKASHLAVIVQSINVGMD